AGLVRVARAVARRASSDRRGGHRSTRPFLPRNVARLALAGAIVLAAHTIDAESAVTLAGPRAGRAGRRQGLAHARAAEVVRRTRRIGRAALARRGAANAGRAILRARGRAGARTVAGRAQRRDVGRAARRSAFLARARHGARLRRDAVAE